MDGWRFWKRTQEENIWLQETGQNVQEVIVGKKLKKGKRNQRYEDWAEEEGKWDVKDGLVLLEVCWKGSEAQLQYSLWEAKVIS